MDICIVRINLISLGFEIYFRFGRIQAYKIFYFLWRLFAKHQSLRS